MRSIRSLRAWAMAACAAMATGISAQSVDEYTLVELRTDTLPNLNMARTGHATLCLDGEVTVLGGHTDGFVPTATAEYYRDGTWHTAPLVYPHDEGAVVKLRSGKVFLAGGFQEPLGIGQLFSAELYDPKTHTSQGFGCMEKKRAYANSIEMADDQVVTTGNWFADDCIEMFGNVNDQFKPNAVKIKDTSAARSTPYILRISEDDAIIFSSLDNHADPIDSSIIDRLQGPAYHEPFLDTWRPLRSIEIRRSDNHFIGNEAEGRYEWLLPVETADRRHVAIARVKGPEAEGGNATFTLLPIAQQLPDSIDGKKIVYSSLVCDRDRGMAYLIGDNDDAQVFVAVIPYDTNEPAPLTIYITEPQQFIARSVTPVLTPEGDLVFAGGHLINNFAPTNRVIRLPLGDVSEPAEACADTDAAAHAPWELIVIACLIACGGVAIWLVRRKKVRGSESDINDNVVLDSNLPKDEALAELFKRIEQLMDEEQLYLNANLRASDVATRLVSNTAYVSAAINSQRGCSFSQFLTNYRIAYAQELMRKNPECKISTVGTQSGFSTDSTFFRAFRASTGMTPKEWIARL